MQPILKRATTILLQQNSKKSLLQIVFGFLLQNGAIITTCVGKKCHVHFEWYYHAFPLKAHILNIGI